MSSLVSRFQQLSIKSHEEKLLIQGYVCSLKSSKDFYKLKRNEVLIADNNQGYVFLKLKKNEKQTLYLCQKCEHVEALNNLSPNADYSSIKDNYCIHAKACVVIWGEDESLTNEETNEDVKALVEVVKQSPKYLAAIHVPSHSKKTSGVIGWTSKTLKAKCFSCKGRDACIHLRIHAEKVKDDQNSINEDANKVTRSVNKTKSDIQVEKYENVSETLRCNKMPNNSSNNKGNNERTHSGPNKFNYKINLPPTKEEQAEYDRIQSSVNPFPENVLAPDANGKCDNCGNKWDKNINIANMEKEKAYIHHTRPVKDCRTSSLITLFRTTEPLPGQSQPPCNCRKYYTGESDKLIRVTDIGKNENNQRTECHFVSYEKMFDYMSNLFEGGQSGNSYVNAESTIQKNIIGNYDNDGVIRKDILSKAFSIFEHSIVINVPLAYICEKCPTALKPGEIEDDFPDVDEVHVGDAVNEGCIINEAKGWLPDKIFESDRVHGNKVKGVEAKERTYLSSAKQRSIIQTLVKNHDDKNILKKTVKALKKSNRKTTKDSIPDTENMRSITELLVRLNEKSSYVPKEYLFFLDELSRETPISALLPSYSDKDFEMLEKYINGEIDIFKQADLITVFYDCFFVLAKSFKSIMDFESREAKSATQLPNDVIVIVKLMIKLRYEFNDLSRNLAAPRTIPTSDWEAPSAEVYPGYPTHTMENEYFADAAKDKEEDKNCEKIYNESPSITGGLSHVSCRHGIVKGFTCMSSGESPQMFTNVLLRRLPRKVRARRRIFLYDNACNCMKIALRRYPFRIRRWQFLVDRHHWSNHTSCSAAFNMSNYSYLKDVNSQLSEQLNRKLRKMAIPLAEMSFENYKKTLEIFFAYQNLLRKGILKK